MARLGISPHIVERVRNHTSGATGGLGDVYQRYEYLDERKDPSMRGAIAFKI